MNTSNNSSMNFDYGCILPSCLFTRTGLFITISILFLLFAASLIGNLLILVLLGKDRQLRARSSPSHISLAIADLIATIFWLPFMVLDLYIVDKWLFGQLMCKIATLFQSISIVSSTLNLCIVAAECFAAVWFPLFLKVLPQKRIILIGSCLFAWCVAFAVSMFYTQHKTLRTDNGQDYFCSEDWPNNSIKEVFIYVHSTVLGLGPLIVITVLNMLCIYRLCQTKNLASRRRHSKGGNYTRSATKKMVTISLIFVVCRSPIHILELMSKYLLPVVAPVTILVLYTLSFVVYFFSAATHPVLFGLMSVYYREALKRSCKCYTVTRRRSTSSSKTGQSSKILETII